MSRQPRTDIEAANKYLESQAEYLSPSYRTREIDHVIQSPENPLLNIVLFGSIEATEIGYNPGNYIDGQCEYAPFEYVMEWEFNGDITVENENCDVIKNINIKALSHV